MCGLLKGMFLIVDSVQIFLEARELLCGIFNREPILCIKYKIIDISEKLQKLKQENVKKVFGNSKTNLLFSEKFRT